MDICNLSVIGGPNCVKCAAKHLAAVCNIMKFKKAKCANCHGLHPVNYQGCIIAKEIQIIQEKILHDKEISKPPPLHSNVLR